MLETVFLIFFFMHVFYFVCLFLQKRRMGVFCKKVFLKILEYSYGNIYVGVSFLKSSRPLDLQLYLKESPTQVFPYKYCQIFKNIYFEKQLQTAGSECTTQVKTNQLIWVYFLIPFYRIKK